MSDACDPADPVCQRPKARRAKEIADVIQRIKAETLPLDKGFFRTAESLIANETVLSDLWRDDQWRRSGDPYDLARIREAEALIATSRWVATSALLRNESRGVHRRTDRPEMDPRSPFKFTAAGSINLGQTTHSNSRK